MKKIILAVLLAALVCFPSCGEEKNKNDTKVEDQASDVSETEKEKIKTSDELIEKFTEYCKNGDVDGMYSLYYDDMLIKMREKLSDKLSADEFDSMLKAEMLSIVDYETFEYGCAEMPEISSPLSYVNQLLYYAGSDSLELTDSQVTDCVDLRVYIENASQPSDHMLACIEGGWYFIV